MMRALVLAPELRLSSATRAALRAVPWQPPPVPRLIPTREGWGLASYDAIPDLVVAEHADPILLAKLLADLMRIRRALPPYLTIVVGSVADDLTRHLLAPFPLPATVLHPGDLAERLQALNVRPRSNHVRAASRLPALHWRTPTPPSFVLRRWRVVPLLAAFDTARTICEAAQWSAMGCSTAYRALAQSAAQLQLSRRWRHPREWRDTLLAVLSYPEPLKRDREVATPPVTMA